MYPSRQLRLLITSLFCLTGVFTVSASQDASAQAAGPAWTWPLAGERSILAPYIAPVSTYAPGHRGVDLPATVGDSVMAPTQAVVSFAGTVAGRGIVSLRTGDLQISFEALAPSITEGDVVEAGQTLGLLTAGTHCECLHVGVRRAGEYLSPMAFYSALAPARLQPWDDQRWAVAEPGIRYPS